MYTQTQNWTRWYLQTYKKAVTTLGTRHYSSTHDYLVLGAGSAGCVVTNRLLTESDHSVNLIDAGSYGALGGPKSLTTNWMDFWKFVMPSALTENLDSRSVYNWHYETVPQRHMNGRTIDQPRGKVLGGSSNLNAMVYVRGHALDFERWNQEVTDGELKWSYKDVLPYFRKAQQDATPFPPVPDLDTAPQSDRKSLGTYKGTDGPLTVTNGSTFSTNQYALKPSVLGRSTLFDVFVEAGVASGYNYSPDLNGFLNEGFGPMDQTVTEHGERCSTERAYLAPLLNNRGDPTNPDKLTVTPNSQILRILFDGVKAIGVEYMEKGSKDVKQAYATKEVICSLGSIGSPQLLMLSGLGPADHLKDHDIDVIVDNDQIGSNLQDHLEFYMQYHCKKPVTLYPVGNWLPSPWYRIMVGLEWFLMGGKGLAGSNQFETGGFIRTRSGIEHPNIQYHFIPGAVVGQSEFLPYHAFQVHCGTLRPSSRGTIRLKSANPLDSPLIDPKYFSSEEDIVDMRDGFKLTEEILNSKPFDDYRGDALHQEEVDTHSDESIDEWIKNKSHSAYHPCCTCAMGEVTDSAGRVTGTENLRVIDASIMPSMTSGNLNAPTIMLAEKISDHVLGKPQRPQELVEWWTNPKWQSQQR
mmetsp:Transcript_12704/g.19678  ORF Transcript_12704/g.19678 Transcript_12704/m.19678 type:complete len:637 (+) Transcript_12704:262-2172(+)